MTKRFLRLGKRGFGVILAGVLAVSLITVPAVPSFAAVTDKPQVDKAGSISVSEENVTEDQPFASNTAGSEHFRIPGLITLENGDLLGIADARWERTADGGGLDTIASVSSDGGKTWSYSFPFFFPDSNGFSGRDSGAPYWSNATTIIDACVLEGADGTVYCFADVNPTGATTLYQNSTTNHIGNNPDLLCTGKVGTGTGYVTVDGKRRLALTDEYTNVMTEPSDDLETYPYYVGDFTDGYAPVLRRDDHLPTGYGVDEWYNLYTVDEDGAYIDDLTQSQVVSPEYNTDPVGTVQQNVYYADSALHIYCIAHIWMVTSKDHGRTWTNPKDINDQVKRHTDENAILVSPGQGTVTSDGTIAFGVYDNDGTTEGQNASIVYSTDRGETWKRSNDVPDMWTSENEIVELADGEGTLRMFCRNSNNKIVYADAKKNDDGEYEFGSTVMTDVAAYTNCNLSAISYSKKINGKQAILLACPAGGGRANGKIYSFLVNEDEGHTMELQNIFSLGGGGYAYSCLTEQADGSLALLWEYGNQGGIFFNTYDIADVVPGVQIENVPVKMEVAEGEEYALPYDGEGVIEAAPDEDYASVSIGEMTVFPLYDHSGTGSDSSLSSFSSNPNGALNLSDAEFTFMTSGSNWKIQSRKTGQYLTNSSGETFFNDDAIDMKVAPVSGKDTFYLSQSNDKRYVIFHTAQMNFNGMSNPDESNTDYELTLLERQATVSEDDVIPGYQKITAISEITSGGRYLIARIWDEENVIVLYPTNGVNNQTKRVDLAQSYTVNSIIVNGIEEGYTQAVIDGTVYQIKVTKEHPQLDSTCEHTTVIKNELEAACELEGYSGDEICTKCGGVVEQGTAIPATGHRWEKDFVSKAVTETESGEVIYRCANDDSHTKTETILVLAYTEFMKAYEPAKDAKENAGLYTADSFAEFQRLFPDEGQSATGMASSRELYENADALNAAQAVLVKKSDAEMKGELESAIQTSEKDAQKPEGILEKVWTKFVNAYANAKKAMDEKETADELWSALKSLQEAQQELDAAKAAAEDSKQPQIPNPPDNGGKEEVDEFVSGGMTYKILDEKTAKLIVGANKSNVVIPNTVADANQKSYQVTVIGEGAFLNKTKIKKVTISPNVTMIEKNAFKGCKKLANVILKNKSKLKTVGGGAFKKTSSKIKVSLPKNLKKDKKLKKQLKKAGIKKGL